MTPTKVTQHLHHAAYPSWPRTAPSGFASATKESSINTSTHQNQKISQEHSLWTSVKNPLGSASICLTVNPSPVSFPSADLIPVLNGPAKHPTDCKISERPSTALGLGKAIRGGPAFPNAAWWMWVDVSAGDLNGGLTPEMVMFYKEDM